MAGKGHQLIQILLAEYFGNPGPLSQHGQLSGGAASQRNNGSYGNQAFGTQLATQGKTAAIAQLAGNNDKIEGLPRRGGERFLTRGKQRKSNTTEAIETLLKNLPVQLGAFNRPEKFTESPILAGLLRNNTINESRNIVAEYRSSKPQTG